MITTNLLNTDGGGGKKELWKTVALKHVKTPHYGITYKNKKSPKYVSLEKEEVDGKTEWLNKTRKRQIPGSTNSIRKTPKYPESLSSTKKQQLAKTIEASESRLQVDKATSEIHTIATGSNVSIKNSKNLISAQKEFDRTLKQKNQF